MHPQRMSRTAGIFWQLEEARKDLWFQSELVLKTLSFLLLACRTVREQMLIVLANQFVALAYESPSFCYVLSNLFLLPLSLEDHIDF